MKFSIAIPAYEMRGIGRRCLNFSLNKIEEQTFKDFQVVVSDSSCDDEIKNECMEWSDKFDIKYIESKDCAGSPTLNSNKVIKNCDGEWIKFLCLDDFLLADNSLQIFYNELDDNFNWMVTAYLHTYNRVSFHSCHTPYLNDQICINNTIGNPSCMILKNLKDLPEFDNNLKYAYDCEFYWRMIQRYGEPKFIYELAVGTLLGDHSLTTELATQEFIKEEENYILRKHGFIK